MIKFKQFVNEMTMQDIKSAGYNDPAPKAKFQLNDWVIIKGNEYNFITSQSKRSVKYIGQYGKVVGYKPGSQYVKYAVQFPVDNNNIEVFHSHFIAGPLKNESDAKKLAIKKFDRTNTTPFKFEPKIKSTAVRGYVQGELQSNPELEKKLIEIFSQEPFGLKVPSRPETFKDSKYIATVLAYRPLIDSPLKVTPDKYHMNIKINSSIFNSFLQKNIVLFRLNNAVSKRIVDLASSTNKLVDPDDTSELSRYIWTASPYALGMPEIDLQRLRYIGKSDVIYFFDKNKFLKQIFEDKNNRFLQTNIFNIPKLLTKDTRLVEQLSERLNNTFNIAYGNYDPKKIFDIYYGIEERDGKKIASNDVTANDETIEYFKDIYLPYQTPVQGVFHHNYELTIRTRDISKIKIPPQMECIKIISDDAGKDAYSIDLPKGGKYVPISDFSFLPKGVKSLTLAFCEIPSLKGIPDPIDILRLDRCKVLTGNLQGIPKDIKVELALDRNNLNSFEGGEDTVVGKEVDIFDENEITSIKGIPESKGTYRVRRPFTTEMIQKHVEQRKFTKSLKPKTQKTFADIFQGLD